MYVLQDETVRAQPVGLANQVGGMGAQLTQLGGGKRRERVARGVAPAPFHAMGAAIRADRRKLELILGWWLDQGSLLGAVTQTDLGRWNPTLCWRGDGSQFLFQCDVSG